jgi:hypothetical protein
VLDFQSIYEVGIARRDDMLREAALANLASKVPSGPSPLRGIICHWLYALADWVERPSILARA